MNQQVWSAVDSYIEDRLIGEEQTLDAVQQTCAEQGLPAISVTAAQGKLLMMIAQMIGAQTILEVGTLGGYSTIWLARGMASSGKLVTLELEPHHAEVARKNIERAGFNASCEVRVGPALASLAALIAEEAAPFDLVFIDADKQSNPDYFAAALKLTRPGSVIIVDNVVRGGAVLDADSDDPAIVGIRRLYDMVAEERRVEATAIQTIGDKNYDGFMVVRVIG